MLMRDKPDAIAGYHQVIAYGAYGLRLYELNGPLVSSSINGECDCVSLFHFSRTRDIFHMEGYASAFPSTRRRVESPCHQARGSVSPFEFLHVVTEGLEGL